MEKCTEKAPKERLRKLLRTRYDDLTSGRREPQTRAGAMILSRPATDIIEMLLKNLDGTPINPISYKTHTNRQGAP